MVLILAVYKLRHYLLTIMVHLISRPDPLKCIMSGPSIQGRISKWTVLSEFNIHYIPQHAIKGQDFVDFLAAHLIPDGSPL